MTDTPMTPDAALARLRQYGESTSTWSTATYNDGTEKALHQIAVSLAGEVERLRAQVAELEAAGSRLTTVQRLAEEADDKNNHTVDTDLLLDALGLSADAPTGARPTGLPLGLTGRARHEARVAMETARKTRRRAGACFTCGDVPDEWCPDCACCKAGCDGGRTNNPCTHPNAPWNTEATR